MHKQLKGPHIEYQRVANNVHGQTYTLHMNRQDNWQNK